MYRYILQRFVYGIPVLLVVAALVFFSIRLVPGDVLTARFEDDSRITPEMMESIRAEMGIDDPAWRAFPVWLMDVATGDLGESMLSGRPVMDSIKKGLPITFEIALLAMLVSIVVAIPAGVVSSLWRNSPIDYVVRLVAVFGQSVPNFVLASAFVLLPAIWFKWSPPVGFRSLTDDPIGHLSQVVPAALVLGFSLSAAVMRMTRSSMLEVLGQDYIRTAWSKGLTQFTVVRGHALKNAFIPILTTLGNQLGFLLGGSVIVESVFSLPGLGQITLYAIQTRDYTQIQAVVLLVAGMYVAVNLLIDISYAVIDPRIRYR